MKNLLIPSIILVAPVVAQCQTYQPQQWYFAPPAGVTTSSQGSHGSVTSFANPYTGTTSYMARDNAGRVSSYTTSGFNTYDPNMSPQANYSRDVMIKGLEQFNHSLNNQQMPSWAR